MFLTDLQYILYYLKIESFKKYLLKIPSASWLFLLFLEESQQLKWIVNTLNLDDRIYCFSFKSYIVFRLSVIRCLPYSLRHCLCNVRFDLKIYLFYCVVGLMSHCFINPAISFHLHFVSTQLLILRIDCFCYLGKDLYSIKVLKSHSANMGSTQQHVFLLSTMYFWSASKITSRTDKNLPGTIQKMPKWR